MSVTEVSINSKTNLKLAKIAILTKLHIRIAFVPLLDLK